MIIECVPVGKLQANCYIVGCEVSREAMIIDPGAEPEKILEALSHLDLKVVAIVNTHGHGDHIGANDAVSLATGAPIYMHAADVRGFGRDELAWIPAVKAVADGDVITVGEISAQVIHTPGHSKGSMCLLCGDVLFSGDTLFDMTIGNANYPGGASDIVTSIKTRLLVLPDETRVYPGHYGSTTIGREKRANPYVGEKARFRLK